MNGIYFTIKILIINLWLEYGAANDEDVMDSESRDLFDSFRVFCNRKNVRTYMFY